MSDAKVILITGAGKGIGLELARTCLLQPNNVVIGSHRNEAAPGVQELKKTQPGEGSRLVLVHIECTSPEDPKRAAAAVEAAGIDHVDLIIANAGMSPMPVLPFEEVTAEDLVEAFKVNAASQLGVFQAFRHLLKKSSSPKWAAIASSSGNIGNVERFHAWIVTAYGMAKAAQNWMTQSLAFSQKDWLAVYNIHPGNVRTEPGNWIARRLGHEQAALTVEQAATAILNIIEETDPEAARGHLLDAMTGSIIPW